MAVNIDQAIESHTRRFRAAMDGFDRKPWGVGFAAFPEGARGDSALLIGTFLREQGIEGFRYVRGGKEQSSNTTVIV